MKVNDDSSFVALLVVANLLGVDDYQLHDALTQKTRVLRGEVIATPLDVDQVCLTTLLPLGLKIIMNICTVYCLFCSSQHYCRVNGRMIESQL